jgi:hypothetical protein
MTLIGEPGGCRYICQAGPPFPHKLNRTLQSQMHDVTVWR